MNRRAFLFASVGSALAPALPPQSLGDVFDPTLEPPPLSPGYKRVVVGDSLSYGRLRGSWTARDHD